MILRNVPWDPVSQGTSVHPPNMRPEQYLQSGTTPSEVNTGNVCVWSIRRMDTYAIKNKGSIQKRLI